MNITFLIGNGFDLRMGMKTRFTDMYEGYIAHPSSTAAIEKFKEMLRQDAPKYETWGDFEMAMAEKAKEFENEAAFIECLRDFKLYMAAHLKEEQEQFKRRLSARKGTEALCKKEMQESISHFYKGLTPNVINRIKSVGVSPHPRYKAISFNYTDVFDCLIPSDIDTIHVHGSLDADVVLGIDSLDQVKGLNYTPTRRFERAFIKPEFNKNYNSKRKEDAENAIWNSNIICIYGMSLGDSDYSWVIKLKEWLLSDENAHLVYFVYDETVFNKLNWDAIMDAEEDHIEILLNRICDSSEEREQVFNQIHIPIGYNIFNIDEILKEEKLIALEEEKRRIALYTQLKEEALKGKNNQ